MAIQKSLTTNFKIKAEITYIEEESRPEEYYHFFSYKISITNTGSTTAQLMTRHWVISDASGNTEEINGAGVVGLQPKIHPGQTFEYKSACPLNAAHGSMKGSYDFITENGDEFSVEIPEFYLISPQALH